MAGTGTDHGKHAGRDHNNVDLSGPSVAAGGSPVLRGYLAAPEGEGPFPAVLMVHEAFGLDDITVRHADRMAAAGYLTLAVARSVKARPSPADSARMVATRQRRAPPSVYRSTASVR